MGHRILTALIALTVVTSGLAGVTAAETSTATELSQADGADVTFENQTTGGDTVTVDSVRLPEGGYVTIHDASLSDGETLGSVAGTSAYLTPGSHENVTVTLTDDASDGTYTAMAHQETDGDRTYEFVASNGETDAPYISAGSAVVDSADIEVSATVSMSDQPTTGESVVVDRVVLSEGGFVTIHDSSVTDGQTFDSIRGTSEYLEAGVHEDVRVQLADPVTENATLVPMAHRDTDGDGAYTFEESGGEADGPYTANGSAVIDTAAVTVAENASASLADQTTGGNHVVVDSVYVPEGGFVTIHDDSLTRGDTFGSVRGTSAFLDPGYHTDVTVALDAPVTNDSTLIAMPHRDTDGDENYTFVESEGSEDGPYVADGGAVTDAGNLTVSASVAMADQTSDGRTVTIDRVDLAEGGFVAIHDATLLDGDTFDSVVGHSEYLEAGVHEDVTVTLDERLTSGQTLIAMPHQDSDGDESYTFAESEGGADGPYVADGGAVIDSSEVTVEASIAFEAQETDGESVTVRSVTLQDGGFVTVHDASLQDGAVFDSIRGTSEYLEPGTHENVTVSLSAPVEESTTLVRDTDGDESYTFVESEGAADGPYLGSGGAVVASAQVTTQMDNGSMTEEMTDGAMTDGAMTDGETATESTGGSGPGFTATLALVALLAAALLVVRTRR
jgi:PGF-CTERM protein